MKNLSIIFSLFFALYLPMAGLAKGETTKTSFYVNGNCNMCKKTIETAAKKSGANSAFWDSKSQQITVTFSTQKTSLDSIQKSIANAGYDNAKYKAPEQVYQQLPDCCQYTRKQE